jgi:HAE1 family hydrophobic/amphiphilic exporter-1
VRERLAEVRADFPAFEIAVVADASPFVRQSISGVWQAVWLGGLLAYGVLLAFLGDLRSPLFLIVALPVSVVSSFALLDVCGISLNLMSLGGLALGIGMLVDNAIICLENIHRLRATGLPAPRAAAAGASEVAMPMLASTLTTCAVFVPLALVPGPMGELFRDQAMAVSVSLGTSLVTALTLLPMLAGRVAPAAPRPPRRPGYAHYHRLLDRALDRPGRVLAATALLVLVSGLALTRVPRELLPPLDTDQVEITLRLPPGTDVIATDRAVAEVEGWLRERPEVTRVFASVGAAVSVDPSERDRRANQGTVRARLTDQAVSHRDDLLTDLLAAFDDRAGWELGVTTDRPELAVLIPAGDATLTCEVRGPDPREAERVAAAILAATDLTVDGHPLRLDAAETEPRYRFELDEEAVSRLGLDEGALLDGIEAETSGLEATRVRRFDREHPVTLRAAEPDPRGATLVAGGHAYPVDAVFTLTQELAPARLVREDQARVATIRWDGPLRGVPEVRTALAAAVTAVDIPPGYTVDLGGSHREMEATLSAIGRAFALSAGLVLLILAAQFESVTLPWLIFAAVPLALVGTAAALLLTGTTVNVISGMGLVVLIGIVVNDAILKVDLFRRLGDAGMPLREAIHVASRRRYRPILMTTATTTLALLPMLVGRGTAFRAPLAVVVIGGLLSATLLTLVVIPVLYQGLARWQPRPRTEPAAAVVSPSEGTP